MYKIRDKNNRDCKIGKQTVCFLDQRKQPELGNPEIHDTADKRCNNLFMCNPELLIFLRFIPDC